VCRILTEELLHQTVRVIFNIQLTHKQGHDLLQYIAESHKKMCERYQINKLNV
jgi:hypothetical protein